LREVVTIHDDDGNVMHKMSNPLMVEFYPRDVVQIMIGASILAIPVGFTEETWNLGGSLPISNIMGILLLSVLFIATFVYYNYYYGEDMHGENVKKHWDEFAKRVFFTYLFAFLIVAIILTLIQRAPWEVDFMLALKRVILVAFPASMSAAVADVLK